MRPGSAVPFPVSTASTGLLCLLVGACVHRGRSITEVECVAATTHILHSVHDIYMSYPPRPSSTAECLRLIARLRGEQASAASWEPRPPFEATEMD